MTVNIYYVRHGDPNYELDTLTELGHKQAKLTSEVLKNISFDAIYASPSNRAVLTGSYLADLVHQEMIKQDWLFEGKAWQNFASYNEKLQRFSWIYHNEYLLKKMEQLQHDDKWYEDKDFLPNVKEGIDRFMKEVDEWLLAMNIKHDRKNKTFTSIGDNPKNIVVFAHEGAGTGFLSSIMDMNYAYFMSNYPRLDCCSITQIEITLDGETINKFIRYNDTNHLKGLKNE